MGNDLVDFLVDNGATYSVLNTKLTKRTSKVTPVAGLSSLLPDGTVDNKDIKYTLKILQLLKAVHCLSKVAVIHVLAIKRGKPLRREETDWPLSCIWAARGDIVTFFGSLLPQIDISKYEPVYSPQDVQQAEEWRFSQERPLRWKYNQQGRILIPEKLLYPILRHLHESTHYRQNATIQGAKKYLTRLHLQKTIEQVLKGCHLCGQNNQKPVRAPNPMGVQHLANG